MPRTCKSCIIALVVVVLLLLSTANADEKSPLLEKQDLFVADEGGYALYHIPGLVVTAKGTILAWCEARENGSDWDRIELLMRRSTDDGKTWSPPRNVTVVPEDAAKNPKGLKVEPADIDGITVNNPVLIADRDGTVHFLYCIEYQRAFYRKSVDDGISWSDPVELTSSFRDFPYEANVIATGPNHGIQHETTAIELADGTVMLNVRNESAKHRRIVVTSTDGATNWSEPIFHDALLEPICMASLIRYSNEVDGSRNRMLFSNPHNLLSGKGTSVQGGSNGAKRRNLSIKLSYDEGLTWPFHKPLEQESGMYSDLAVTSSGTIFCFYGRRLTNNGTAFAGDRLTLARFNLCWLTEGADLGD